MTISQDPDINNNSTWLNSKILQQRLGKLISQTIRQNDSPLLADRWAEFLGHSKGAQQGIKAKVKQQIRLVVVRDIKGEYECTSNQDARQITDGCLAILDVLEPSKLTEA